jgi:hypothetical protein
MKNVKAVMEALIKGEKLHYNAWQSEEYVCLNNGILVDECGAKTKNTSIFEYPECVEIYNEYSLGWMDVINGFDDSSFEQVKSTTGIVLDCDFECSRDVKLSTLRNLKWKAL